MDFGMLLHLEHFYLICGGDLHTNSWNTVFIRIVAAATINFSLAWVRLLTKGGIYSRAAFTYLRPVPHSVLHKNCTEDWFMKTLLRVINI